MKLEEGDISRNKIPANVTSLGPCVRCGKPGTESFDLCADHNALRSLCDDCDIELNELVLRWVGDPDVEAKIAAYRKLKSSIDLSDGAESPQEIK